MTTVVLFSGGLDSTTLLADCVKTDHHRHVIPISFDYGQRHKTELKYAADFCHEMGLPHMVVKMDERPFLGSSLTGGGQVPYGHYADENMKATIVPNRNAVMLSIGFAVAVSTNAGRVAYAAHAGDHPIYPDCRPEFMQAFQRMQQVALDQYIELYTPFMYKLKSEIVEYGASMRLPFKQTWSCYEGGEIHCGKCGTCVERKEAFRLARVADPTDYADPEFSVEAYRG